MITNSDLCHLQHKLIGFYNPEEKCLQGGTDWGFKYSGLRFVFRGLTISNYVLSYYIKYQQDATLAVLFISNCQITLHVSEAFCVHHQEY